jgi:hypothetical protein
MLQSACRMQRELRSGLAKLASGTPYGLVLPAQTPEGGMSSVV